MTVTDTEPSHETAHASTGAAAPVMRAEPGPVARSINLLGSGDHKDIGRFWILAALDFALLAFVVGIFVGLERISLNGNDIFQGSQATLQGWTLYRLGFVFMVVVPLMIGVASVIVPLQVGAPSISYPRLLSASFWTWLVSSVIFAVAHLIDGGFIPLGQRGAVELTVASFFFMMVAIIAASGCIVTTVITQRSRGMSLGEVPMFSWSMLVAGALWMLTLPVMMANLVVIWIDLEGATGRYSGDMWEQVRWVTDQPQVFAFALPLLGIAADIIPTAFTERTRGSGVTQGAIGLFGILSFGAYAQRFFHADTSGTPVYVLGALAMVLPIVLLLLPWLDGARRSGGLGTVGPHTLMALLAVLSLLGAGAISALRVLGGLLGIFGSATEDVSATFNDLAGTSIEAAVFNGVTAAGLLGVVAGIWFWAPKIFGRQLNKGIGGLAGLVLAGGAIVTAVPDAVSGFLEQRDFAINETVKDGVETLNIVSLVGRGLLLAGALMVIGAITLAWISPSNDEDADPDNPYGGHTLEWATSSPPPRGNFAAPMSVTSERPLLDLEGEAR